MHHGQTRGYPLKDFASKTLSSIKSALIGRVDRENPPPKWRSRRTADVIKKPKSDGEDSLVSQEKALPSRTSSRRKYRFIPFPYRRRPSFRPLNRMRSYIQFLSVPTADTPGTGLLLVFDDRRYFFGQVHEGAQRVGLEMNAKFIKLKEIFISGKIGVQTIGGLLGMSLTMADAIKAKAESEKDALQRKEKRYLELVEEQEERRKKAPAGKMSKSSIRKPPAEIEQRQELGIHGGPNLMHTIATARSFIFRQGVPMHVEEYTDKPEQKTPKEQWEPTWSDDHIRVWAMAVSSSASKDVGPESRPQLPKKRSLDEFRGSQPDGKRSSSRIVQSNGTTEPEDDHAIRQNAVREMFMSEWRYDNLVETHINEVDLPAKLFVRDRDKKHLVAYTGPLPGGPALVPDINVFVRKPWPGALISNLPASKPSPTAISYIVRNHKQRGKFKPETAKSLGVPSGPAFASLARGLEVKTPNGDIVTPEMVLDPGKEGSGFAILDVPSKEHIPALVSRPEWEASTIMEGIETFIWILGPGVAQEESLQDFIRRKDKCLHMFSSPQHCPNQLMMSSAAVAATRHQYIDPERYGSLQFSNRAALEKPECISREGPAIEVARPGLKLQLEPVFEFGLDNETEPVNLAEALRVIPKEVFSLVKKAKDDVKRAQPLVDLSIEDLASPEAEITCLGTGSAAPSLFRNVSATLLRVPGHGSYLFDAGENTLGQLQRRFAPEELKAILRDLKMIWISHLHADHHLGTASIIKAWYNEVHSKSEIKSAEDVVVDRSADPVKAMETENNLFVVGHSLMMRWLREFSSVEDFGFQHIIPLQVVPAKAPNWSECSLMWDGTDVGFNTAKEDSTRSAIRKALSLSNLVACNVSHCAGSFAVSVTFPTGFKFSYSGDCRPSKNFVAIGADSTMLIHEATFDDELHADAVAKRHSTISEAIGVGVRMRARSVILTHFSQRFSKMPSMEDITRSIARLQSSKNPEADEADEEAEGDDTQPIIEDVPLEAKDPLTDSPPQEPSHHLSFSPLPHSTTYHTSTDNEPSSSLPTSPHSTARKINIAVAFDYMRVRNKDIPLLEYFTPALRELYKEENVGIPLEEKKVKEVVETHEKNLADQAAVHSSILSSGGAAAEQTKDKTMIERDLQQERGQGQGQSIMGTETDAITPSTAIPGLGVNVEAGTG